MEEIEAFVRKLCAEGDLSVLTKRLIRTQYQSHFNKSTVTREEKEKINEVLENVIQELADQSRDLVPHVNIGGNANLDQGKENLRTDYVCLSNTPSPTLLAGQKVVHKVSRAELGDHCFGHNHLRRIQLSLNHGGSHVTSRNSSSRNDEDSSANGQPARELLRGFQSSRAGNESASSSGQRTECDAPEISGQGTECDKSEFNGQRTECDTSEISGQRTECDASEFNGQRTECDASEITVSHKDRAGHHTSPGSSSKAKPSTGDHRSENKHLTKVTDTDLESESSEDGVLLLTLSDSSTSASTRSQGARLANRERETGTYKDNCEKSKLLSALPGGHRKAHFVASSRGRQQTKAVRKVSLQTALSAIMESESDDSQTSVVSVDFLNGSEGGELSSPIAQPSGLSQPSTLAGLSQPSTLAGLSQLAGSAELSKPPEEKHNGPKDANIYTRLKMRFGLQDKTADSEKLSALNKFGSNSHLCGDLDVESDDSLDTPLVIDESPRGSEVEEESFSPLTQPAEGSSQSSRVCDGSKDSLLKKRNGNEEELLDLCEDSASDRSTSGACCQAAGRAREAISSQDIKHTGFATFHFFRKKPAQITPNQRTVENSEKPILVVGSNSDTSQDLVMLKAQSDNSDLGEMLETRAKPSTEEKTEVRADLWKRGRCLKAVSDTGEKAEHKRQANILKAVPLGKVAYPYGQSQGSGTLKEKKQRQRVRGENITEQLMAAGDELDLGDMPLSHLRQMNAKPKKTDNRGQCSAGPDNAEFSKRHEKVRHKCEQQPPKKKQKRERLEPKTASNRKGRAHASPSPFSPPLSPVVKKSTRQNQKQLVGKPTVPKRKNAWNVCTADTTSHKRSVSSLSESTDDEAIVNQSLKTSLENANGRKGRGMVSVFKTHVVPSKRLQFALTDSIGDQVCSVVRNFTTAGGGCSSQSQPKSDEPWKAVPYKGEMLKFPVIKLQDVRNSKSHPTGDCGEEIVSHCRRERNLFDFFKSSSQREQDCLAVGEPDCVDAASETSTSSACLPKLAKAQERSVARSSERGRSVRIKQAGSLDESRRVLRKQRTVKRLAPKLCTTLRLRKQASPNKLNSSSEVEEWTVVTQDDQPGGAYCQREFSQREGLSRKKARSKKRKAMLESSSDEDDQPLKRRTVACVDQSDDGASSSMDEDFVESVAVKTKKPKKKLIKAKVQQPKVQLNSSDEDNLPLKPRRAAVGRRGEEEDSDDDDAASAHQGSSDNATPVKAKKHPQGRKRVQLVSDDEDDVPLKARPAAKARGGDESSDDDDGAAPPCLEDSDDDTPLKVKTSPQAWTPAVISSHDNSPLKSNAKTSGCPDSDLDTSSLSSDGENEAPPQPMKRSGHNIKFTKRKVQHMELAYKQPTKKARSSEPGASSKGAPSEVNSSAAASSSGGGEAPYLKRLRVICRKVGIFVRNDVHFAGCTTDSEKVERLKEALRKAGMKGQPSLSKVDAVNLKKEAAALDTSNIIQTSGRPKRQPKALFTRTNSPKKSLSPIKLQFSRIRDLISESESD